MNIGDLVTLSSAGKSIQRVTDQHKRFFRGPNSTYYGLCDEDRERFLDYWQKDQMVGLVTKVVQREGRGQYDWEAERYVYRTSTVYEIAWQANPEAMATSKHSRGHLKFVKKRKKNK
tara:strand:- start:775 stop:1125 length:351 start_codon:yes stop_codon:yes gene_type:complete